MVTGKASRRWSRPELRKKRSFRRLGGLENVSGSALGRQECGEGGGELNLVGEGASEVYWTVELH